MKLIELEHIKEHGCVCGREHTCRLDDVIVGSGVLSRIPEVVARYGAKKVFVMSDLSTYKAAGERVCAILSDADIPYTSYVLPEEFPKPHEHTVGSFVLHYDYACDLIIAVGSGVINDSAKFFAAFGDTPFIIAATAPSMDGYASSSSSMERDGLKISITNKNADVIIGDTDILRQAPMRMLFAGLGDIVAKCVALCDWRIAHIVTGAYYCEEIAAMVRSVLRKCLDNAEGLISRDPDAIEAVFRAMVLSGISMTFAGTSQPASGVEHSLSHIWDMRGLAYGTVTELHGIQCAVGTFIALKNYEKLRGMTPDREKALAHARSFDYGAWSDTLLEFVGEGAKSMIKLEATEGKYDTVKHAERLERIIDNWEEICRTMDEELPSCAELEALYKKLRAPITMSDIGMDESILPLTYAATRDIRDKYIQSRLVWDLGAEL